MGRLVFEIGTEEVPPRFLPGALASLEREAAERLAEARLTYARLRTVAAARRLALLVEGLADHQASRPREEKGPPARAAYDAAGKPTRAAEGFARRYGVPVDQLEVRTTAQGEYVFARFVDAGRPAAAALADLLPGLVTALSFPKTMRWGEGSLRFARPVRWLLARLDDEVIPCEVDGLRAGGESRGHPVLSPGPAPVIHAAAYLEALEARYVLADQEERAKRLREQLESLARAEGAELVEDPALFEETLFGVEWPTAFVGSFGDEFLSLPREVLIQRLRGLGYFALARPKGLAPRFIAVRDGDDRNLAGVREGNEWALRAKLLDAVYFYQQDLKVPLAERVERLRGVIFQERLGSIYDKTERVRALVNWLAEALGLSAEERAAADRAAFLCKADLVSEVVSDRELSALQGTMGACYARAAGEPESVAAAIGEHYRPRFADDEPPRTAVGQALALADKLDTITGCFAAGLLPTGSEDPYGLRREAQGVMGIILRAGLHLPLEQAVDQARTALRAQKPELDGPAVKEQVLAFIEQRLATHLMAEPPAGRGLRYDLVNAAMGVERADLVEIAARAVALQELAQREDFLPTVVASTRLSNIVRGFAGGEVDPARLVESMERKLWETYEAIRPEVERLAAAGDYERLLERLAATRAVIDRFFDDVLVMAGDEAVRRNRLALVWQMNQLFRRLGDLSQVVQE